MNAEQFFNLLKAVMPNCRNTPEWAQPLLAAMGQYGVTKDEDSIAAFLAQIAVESNELNDTVENLSYSAPRLMAVWPKRFPTLEFAATYERNPPKIANYVYGNRLGNGPPESGDGWRYRGRGLIQLTGKRNYEQASRDVGMPFAKFPAMLEEKWPAALVASYFWQNRKLDALADDLPNDDDEADFLSITRIINGGTEGQVRRRTYWLRVRKYLGLPT